MEKNMTEGNSLKQILCFAFPLLLGNLFQQLYNLADSIIVGKTLGIDALASVGASGSLNFLITWLLHRTVQRVCDPGRADLWCEGVFPDAPVCRKCNGARSGDFHCVCSRDGAVLQTDPGSDPHAGEYFRRRVPVSDHYLYRDSIYGSL